MVLSVTSQVRKARGYFNEFFLPHLRSSTPPQRQLRRLTTTELAKLLIVEGNY